MRAHLTRVVPLALLCGVLFGCSEDAATAEDAKSVCQSYCDWRQRCDKREADCMSKCMGDAGIYGNYRATALETIAGCFATQQDCGSDDGCLESAMVTHAAGWEQSETYKACQAARQACETPPFTDDICFMMGLMTEAAVAGIEGCYSKPCAEQGDCVGARLGATEEDDSLKGSS